MPILALDIQIKMQGTLIARINNATKGCVRELMDTVVLPAARSMAPKRTGANAASLSTFTRRRGNFIQSYIRSNSGHGRYDETGTVHQAARPYMHPALEQSLPAIYEMLATRYEQLQELDDIVMDGGIEGMQEEIANPKRIKKGPRMSDASRANRANSIFLKKQDKFMKENGGRKFAGPMRPKRKYTRKPK